LAGLAKRQRMIGDIIIKHLELIGSLSDEDRQALRGIRGEIREVARGEDVLRQGDHPKEAVVVVSGLLQRYTVSPQGDRQIHSFYIPTDTPCLETLHIDVMDNALATVTASRVAFVPHAELYTIMDAHPRVLALIWRETLVQAAIFREWLMRNSKMLAHVNMAHFFCEMMIRAKAAGIARGNSCDLPITQEELGDALGMTSVHVNRTLAMLRTGGLVEFRSGVLTALDWDKLVDTAEFDPSYLHLHRSYSAAPA
jgi:CRP-like cAMP-binding protein